MTRLPSSRVHGSWIAAARLRVGTPISRLPERFSTRLRSVHVTPGGPLTPPAVRGPVAPQEGRIMTIYLKPKYLAAWLVAAGGTAAAIAAAPVAAADLVFPT